ncbi:DNA polymerase IV [Peribacillus deserti]|uniref:DNA polymerase IV n=1 Tax=Peribacillus deserti TaxID=673318 RepID=A0A2N5M0G1_9BACI|nr:DNA polymerase IV [Peribacillus deserti]PLT27849.1 DNA polymerase IV [Peribacillus deserti]
MHNMYPKKGRVILHVDMNSFYASVEMAYDSSLKGKPLAIAGNVEERRGIIVTCSYEARRYGVKTTMPLWEAKKLCPQLIVKSPDFDKYRKASLAMFDLLRQYTSLVEPVSIDEGYMDISGCHEIGSPIEIAKSIQQRILQTLDLPCSIGIAPNKFLAKTASDMKKPMGITVLRKRDVRDRLWPLKVTEMHGIGEKTGQKLESLGVRTIGDLAQANEVQLRHALGINGLKLRYRANGEDSREVDPDSIYEHKSVGNSTTLPHDSTNQKELLTIIHGLSEKVAVRLKRKGLAGQKIGITIRYKNRKTITRSKTLLNPITAHEEISEEAQALFKSNWNGDAVRLLGVTAFEVIEKQEAYKQLDLFSYQHEAKKEPLFSAMEKLQAKYGKKAVQKGLDYTHDSGTNLRAETSFSKDFLDPRH